jgi:hypothetical protein
MAQPLPVAHRATTPGGDRCVAYRSNLSTPSLPAILLLRIRRYWSNRVDLVEAGGEQQALPPPPWPPRPPPPLPTPPRFSPSHPRRAQVAVRWFPANAAHQVCQQQTRISWLGPNREEGSNHQRARTSMAGVVVTAPLALSLLLSLGDHKRQHTRACLLQLMAIDCS